MNSPYILDETENFAVVFKPPRMHCEPLEKDLMQSRKGEESVMEDEGALTILEWYCTQKGFAEGIRLMHRLDFETNGLVLFAKNESSYNSFKEQQENDGFVKEYSAVCVSEESSVALDGFPNSGSVPLSLNENSSLIQSYFRPYGSGRKQVRPVIDDGKKHKEIAKDKGGFYKTEIISVKENVFTVRIKRGFRHQIRCHLCWAGFPIQNDPLYTFTQALPPLGELALRSHALFFADPKSERQLCFNIAPLASSQS